jgi:hypothetical protein
MRTLLLALLLLAADPRDAVVGRWSGTWLCTKARAACRDEVVVCHVVAAKAPDVVTVTTSTRRHTASGA